MTVICIRRHTNIFQLGTCQAWNIIVFRILHNFSSRGWCLCGYGYFISCMCVLSQTSLQQAQLTSLLSQEGKLLPLYYCAVGNNWRYCFINFDQGRHTLQSLTSSVISYICWAGLCIYLFTVQLLPIHCQWAR